LRNAKAFLSGKEMGRGEVMVLAKEIVDASEFAEVALKMAAIRKAIDVMQKALLDLQKLPGFGPESGEVRAFGMGIRDLIERVGNQKGNVQEVRTLVKDAKELYGRIRQRILIARKFPLSAVAPLRRNAAQYRWWMIDLVNRYKGFFNVIDRYLPVR
jgi:soluble cytochrome b562